MPLRSQNAFQNAQITVEDIKGKLRIKIEQSRKAIQESKKAAVLKNAASALAELDTYGTASTTDKYLDEIKQRVAESKAAVEVATGGLDVERIKTERKARQLQAQVFPGCLDQCPAHPLEVGFLQRGPPVVIQRGQLGPALGVPLDGMDLLNELGQDDQLQQTGNGLEALHAGRRGGLVAHLERSPGLEVADDLLDVRSARVHVERLSAALLDQLARDLVRSL